VKDKKIKKNHEKFDIKIAKNNVGRHDQIKNKKNDKVRTNGKSKKHNKRKLKDTISQANYSDSKFLEP
jgi:hypothetical protein